MSSPLPVRLGKERGRSQRRADPKGRDRSAGARRIPVSTYRLQFNGEFRFKDAIAITPYLQELGIGDCYASPIFKSRPGSTHGYDVCSFEQINPSLGKAAEFEKFVAQLHAAGMGVLLDIVPNHMGNDGSNDWWMDVLEHGPESRYATWFDIDWKAKDPELTGKVLLPILEDEYGRVLESGKLRLLYEKDRL